MAFKRKYANGQTTTFDIVFKQLLQRDNVCMATTSDLA